MDGERDATFYNYLLIIFLICPKRGRYRGHGAKRGVQGAGYEDECKG